MMRENPYAGVNAHLNSALQSAGTIDQPALWHTFHQSFIVNIAESLNAQLPDQYIALAEQSLQSRDMVFEFGEIITTMPQPDVTVFERYAHPASAGVAAPAPDWSVSLSDVAEALKPPSAVIIRELVHQKLGRVVTRIELLSPSNKPYRSGYQDYRQRRLETLHSGLPLVEIDLLHEQPPVILQVPRYPQHEKAYPYNILVSDPRPEWDEGETRGYGFRVNEPFKPFLLPLLGQENLIFEAQPVYDRTFIAGRWGDLLNYDAPPERFDTYSPDDQRQIYAVMEGVQNPS
jgi:hypothetical protein